MSPPPRPDDDPLPPPVAPASGWEVVEPAPARDPLLDDPLFAEIVESKPLPDLTLESAAPPPPTPIAVPVEAIPVAEEVELPRAAPVASARRGPSEPPRPRPVPPPPPRHPEEAQDGPQPRVLMACGVMGCFGLSLLAAIGFLAYAAIALLSGIAESGTRPSSRIAARPGPVETTALGAAKSVILIPNPVDAVGRAAGGRFLLLRVPGKGEIQVFDPNEGKITRTFAVEYRGALFAGSASKMYVYRSNATGAELERWDLTTGLKEKTAPRPQGVAQPDAIVAGAGVDGPVYLVSVPSNGIANVRVLNPDTLAQVTGHIVPGWQGGPQTHIRASDDGTVLGVTTSQGAQVVRVLPQEPLALLKLRGVGGVAPVLATPARDGRLVFTPAGVYDAVSGGRKANGTRYNFPAAHGSGLYLSLEKDEFTKALSGPVQLHTTAKLDPSVELPDGNEFPGGYTASDASDLPPDQRFHLWPAAGLTVAIRPGGTGGTQLDVRKVNVPALLHGLKASYLVLGSEPRLWVVRGQEWRYRPVVWTDEDTVPALEKIEGPRDLVLRNGEFVWTPGKGDSAATTDVVIRVTAGDQTTEQRFRITVLDDDNDDD